MACGFSEVGDRYGEQLARGLRLTGYPASHFAARRIARVRELAATAGVRVDTVVDFGCGVGGAFSLLADAFPGARVVGYEPTPGLREVARETAASSGAEVVADVGRALEGIADLVYCNGVFHHIAPNERIDAIAALARTVRAGGLACVWENSPLNPGTRLVMARVPFDRDARPLGPSELEVLQLSAGITPFLIEYHFVFPRVLRWLDQVEVRLRRLPIGGQYLVAGRRD